MRDLDIYCHMYYRLSRLYREYLMDIAAYLGGRLQTCICWVNIRLLGQAHIGCHGNWIIWDVEKTLFFYICIFIVNWVRGNLSLYVLYRSLPNQRIKAVYLGVVSMTITSKICICCRAFQSRSSLRCACLYFSTSFLGSANFLPLPPVQ